MKYKVGDVVVVKGIRLIADEAVYGWMGTGTNISLKIMKAYNGSNVWNFTCKGLNGIEAKYDVIGIMLEDIICLQGEELSSYKTTVDSKYRF